MATTTEPIHSDALESNVLANMMASLHCVVESQHILSEECFYRPAHRDIYRAVMSVYRRGLVPDMMLVISELPRTGSKVTALEVARICADSRPIIDVAEHALILRDYCARRTLRSLAVRLAAASADEAVPVDEIHADSMRTLEGLFETSSSRPETLATAYTRLCEHVDANQSRAEGEVYGTPTGFDQLDRRGGLCPGDLVVVGAETSQGKTSFATAMALSAISNGAPVAFYSMEMTEMQLTARIASMKCGIPSSRILYERLDPVELWKVHNAMQDVDTSKMYFDTRSTSSLESILMSVRTMSMRHGVKGVVVDYLQLINARDGSSSREQATARCARELKNLAKELGIWVILISQLSRSQQNPQPTLSRLRDSGQIEEAADTILLIYRPAKGAAYPEPYTAVATEGTALVTIAKGRNIGTGSFICGFSREATLFYGLGEGALEALKTVRSAPAPDFPLRPDFDF